MADTASSIPTSCIALIGFRGSGKTTVGQCLAERVGAEAVDTDELIERRLGKSIAAIFGDEGEQGFRIHESRILAEVLQNPPRILSVGGGALTNPDNRRKLRQSATVVWLTAPPAILRKRIGRDAMTPARRPPLVNSTGPEDVEATLAQRTPHYEQIADIRLDTSQKDPRQIAEEILQWIGSRSPGH